MLDRKEINGFCARFDVMCELICCFVCVWLRVVAMGVDVGKEVEDEQDQWGTEVVPHVMQLVSAHLGQRDVCALLCVSTSICHQLTSHAPLWKVCSRFSFC
jgi:hypothetical protein